MPIDNETRNLIAYFFLTRGLKEPKKENLIGYNMRRRLAAYAQAMGEPAEKVFKLVRDMMVLRYDKAFGDIEMHRHRTALDGPSPKKKPLSQTKMHQENDLAYRLLLQIKATEGIELSEKTDWREVINRFGNLGVSEDQLKAFVAEVTAEIIAMTFAPLANETDEP